MTAKAISRQEIIMNFTTPPSADDIAVFARQALENLPDELASKCEDLILEIEEFPDDATAQDMELDTLYELLALYHSAKEISPGVQKKIANGDEAIILGFNVSADANARDLALHRGIEIHFFDIIYKTLGFEVD